MNIPSPNEIQGKWQQQVGSAKVVWGKLTGDEILSTEGQVQRLSGLVQERYGMTRDAADEQVNGFFGRHSS
jgi:uncharacterized protein YjbJ (UPF0337 family)